MRSMRYIDGHGKQQTLTFVQWVYLDTANWHPFDQGWGGLRSTLVVRLLRERGLIQFQDSGPGPWRVTNLTKLGGQVLAAWRAKAESPPD